MTGGGGAEAGGTGGWIVVVPVKAFAVAKSRLSPHLADEHRAALARAFAADTVAAVSASSRVGGLIVVTAEAGLRHELEAAGIEVVEESDAQGLDAAIELGIGHARRRAEARVAVLLGDLPALRTDELNAALDAAARHPLAFVADQEGTGSTLVTALAGAPLLTAFGHDSAVRHRAAGFADLVGLEPASTPPGLRRDVDTVEALEEALRLGVGARTAEVVAGFADEALPHAPGPAPDPAPHPIGREEDPSRRSTP